MSKPVHIWLAFAAALLVAISAVGWLSYRALVSESAEQDAQQRAELEENARLALWRIDSSAGALVAQENAQPYQVYRPFLAGGAPTLAPKRQHWVPSPLLAAGDPRIKLHFEFEPGGELRSPRAPTGEFQRRALPNLLTAAELERTRELLAECAALVENPSLLDALPAAESPLAGKPRSQASFENEPASSPYWSKPSNEAAPGGQSLNFDGPASVPQQAASQSFNQQPVSQKVQEDAPNIAVQRQKGAYEFQARSQALMANSVAVANDNRLQTPADVQTAVMTPLWVGRELLLARRVEVDGHTLIQGCWLDWPLLSHELLAQVCDLLPEAQLQPAVGGEWERAHLMAALPVELTVGEPVARPGTLLSPARLSLLVTWCSLLLAALAVALLLHGVLTLSERRAAFVSAVTHELRTPLTTFRMYAEMLAEGMVSGEAERRQYLETLRVEAERLTHLVENVLAYARLERGGPGARIGPVPVARLVGQADGRLFERARQTGFEVRLEAPPEVLAAQAIADPAAVEQILFNLVDNACKYARSAENRTLELSVGRSNGHIALRLADYGPGVAAVERKRLFQPFRKSARDAAQSAPGVGLGLALSRRLARDMGGDLSLDAGRPRGASFVLTLQAAVAVA